ncbi:hypothetical protein ATANTOWER_029255 [Ataeniobius toweri]|uniref:Uncharacterized protein n=1 Tax=Ataeniobius toweri TaxID=208326 RepID=A0ABU7AC45_9TELE|nr:hypothetical protein [Ataeniobius toweri]
MLRAPLLLPPAPVHLPFSGRPTTPPSSPALFPSVFAPVSTPCTPPLTTLSGFASFLPPCGFNLTVWACSNKLFTAGGLVMAEGVPPENYCDEPVEDEFGEIIKCRSGKTSKLPVCMRGSRSVLTHILLRHIKGCNGLMLIKLQAGDSKEEVTENFLCFASPI